MPTNEDIINYTIKPHGGELINRVVEGKEREALIEKANAFKSLTFKSLVNFRFRINSYWWF